MAFEESAHTSYPITPKLPARIGATPVWRYGLIMQNAQEMQNNNNPDRHASEPKNKVTAHQIPSSG
jgi:hypothetical protein